MRLDGPQSRSGHGGEEKNSQHLSRLGPPDHPGPLPGAVPLSCRGSIFLEGLRKTRINRSPYNRPAPDRKQGY